MSSEWVEKRLDEVSKIVNGGTPKTKVDENWGGPHRWITPAEMGKRSTPLVSKTARTLSDAGLQGSSANLIPPSSIILSTRAPIGHLVINTEAMAFNQGCRGLVPYDGLDYRYLYYFLLGSVGLMNDLGTGATFKELSASKLKGVQIPFPPLPEQKQIVAILDKAFTAIDQAVANAERNLNNARELFESYLNKVFTERGEGWGEKRLGDVMAITHGYAFKGKDFIVSSDKAMPIVLTPGNYTEEAALNFTGKNTKRLIGELPDGYKFDDGDLTIVMTDLSSKMKILGKPAFVEQPNVLHNQRIGRVVMKEELIDEHFIYYFLQTKKYIDNIKLTATGTMVKHTAPKRILSNVISYPLSREQQESISHLLDILIGQRMCLETIYQQKLTALTELKQSILQKAFRGELTTTGESYV